MPDLCTLTGETGVVRVTRLAACARVVFRAGLRRVRTWDRANRAGEPAERRTWPRSILVIVFSLSS